MIIVKFNQLAPVAPKAYSREELMLVYKAACDMLDQLPAHELDQTLDDWEVALQWTCISRKPIDDIWYTQALLLICCRGLLGEIAPDFYTINNNS